MDSLKQNIARAHAQVHLLEVEEARLLERNRQLKEDAALRWVRSAGDDPVR
jgi:hypothetical protein